jgi:endonuclease III
MVQTMTSVVYGANTRRDRIGEIASLLQNKYPATNLGNKTNPLDELLFILLSLQTNEDLYIRSYAAFKKAFPKWDDVVNTKVSKIERVIQESGLAKQKAVHIHSIAKKLRADFGRVTLAPLRRMDSTEAERYLLSLPGVGIKTARCVLMYALGHDVFPVDTHCARVMDRLQLITWNGKRLETVANAAQEIVPPDLRKHLHILLVQHGRSVCRSKPNCYSCVLAATCPSARTLEDPK